MMLPRHPSLALKKSSVNKLTSSLAAALGRRALQLHPKEVTLLMLQGKHSPRDLRAALLGDWKAPERMVSATRFSGAQTTIEGAMTTERAARCAAARTAFAQCPQYFRRVVFQAPVLGALTFGLEVAPLTEVDIRVLHSCLVSLLFKFLGRRACRFEHGRIVAKISAEKAPSSTFSSWMSQTGDVGQILNLQLVRQICLLTHLQGPL